MSLEPQSEVTLTIEKPAAGGAMLARHEGQVVFVSGAIPGERVRAHVDRVTRQLGFAHTTEVLERSPDRRDAGVDGACGGSVYAHIAYQRQLSLKSELIADAFARIAKVHLPAAVEVMASAEDGYRMRARLHLRNGRIGFFREGTHDLCEPGPTRQLLPAAVDALERLEAILAAEKIRAGLSCELVENIPADQRVIWLEFDDGRAALAADYESSFVTERVEIAGGSLVLTHDVRSFFQGNRWLLPRLAERVVAQVPEGSVTDLYAGVGLFAVSLAALGRGGILAVEGNRWSAADLATNARPYSGALAVTHASVEEFLSRLEVRAPQTFVLDPPRTGVSGEALSGILALKAPRVVYVSCDLATLARDVRRFIEAGYRLDHLEGFDLFPNTAHVECLAVLVH